MKNILMMAIMVCVVACNNGTTNSSQPLSCPNQPTFQPKLLSESAAKIESSIQIPIIPQVNCLLTGVTANGETLDTVAIQTAINNCSANGGGIVTLAPLNNNRYLSGPITLKNNVELYIPESVTLLASNDRNLYSLPESKWIPFIQTAKNAHDVTIAGGGTIDGQGKLWWEYYLKNDGKGSPTNRPRMIVLNSTNRVLISQVHLANSPSFFIVPTNSQNITVDNIVISAPESSPNTDGVDPSNSQYVVVRNSTIGNGDDNIAIKAGSSGLPTESIVVHNCTFLTGHGASIGSETSSGVHDVYFENITFNGADNGLRIKSNAPTGGEVSNIYYNNIQMTNVGNLILVTGYYPNIPPNGTSGGSYITGQTPYFHNIHFNNVLGCGNAGWGVVGLPQAIFNNISFDNVNLFLTGVESPMVLRNATIFSHNFTVQLVTGESVPFDIQENVNLNFF